MNNLLIHIVLLFLLVVNTTRAEVAKIDYNFTFDKFNLYLPGASLKDILQQNPKAEMINKSGVITLYRADISHDRYKFPIFFQIKSDIVVDFFAKLPSYFLHDIFHQSLINRYGKQDKFSNTNNHAFYKWENREDFIITYSGACTITCFPIFIHFIAKKEQTLLKESLLKKMNENKL